MKQNNNSRGLPNWTLASIRSLVSAAMQQLQYSRQDIARGNKSLATYSKGLAKGMVVSAKALASAYTDWN